ncbi:MAG: hypothetical protein R6V62_02470 [Candidatus Fermentibacteraceae bacterium]
MKGKFVKTGPFARKERHGEKDRRGIAASPGQPTRGRYDLVKADVDAHIRPGGLKEEGRGPKGYVVRPLR